MDRETVGERAAAIESAGEPAISVTDLVVEFSAAGGRTVRAVSGISFDVNVGETVGLVGESGCGKSTVAKAVAQQLTASSGTIRFAGQDVSRMSRRARRKLRTRLQMIFQDPVSSLNPRRSIEDQIGEGLRVWGVGRSERVTRIREMMEACGLRYLPALKRRRHEFSGGQCQRIAIARALVLEPNMLICDESVSALDVSVQAQVLNLLMDMRDRYGLSMLFISHDLAVVDQVSDRVIVMYLGKVCEVGTPETLFERPMHPYTRMLIDSRPDPELALSEGGAPRSVITSGEIPSPLDPPSGCRFRTRCPRATDLCAAEEPPMRDAEAGHQFACHFPLEALTAGLRERQQGTTAA